MHMCWLGGHFDEEYTPWEYLRRGAKASLSVIRLPSRRKTASVPATSRNPRPRTRNEPCWTTAARSASRCSAAQRGARSEEHTSELQSQSNLVCRLLLEKKKKRPRRTNATVVHRARL